MSLMCEKCNDIHTAQREGKQDKPCSCICHPVTNIPAPDWNQQCTCGTNNAICCPVHGYQWTFTSGSNPTTWTNYCGT